VGKEGVGRVVVIEVDRDTLGFTLRWHDRLGGWGRFWRTDRGHADVKMVRDPLDVGVLEDTSIADPDRRFGNPVRCKRVRDPVMLEFEKRGNLLEGQEIIHLDFLGIDVCVNKNNISLPQSLA